MDCGTTGRCRDCAWAAAFVAGAGLLVLTSATNAADKNWSLPSPAWEFTDSEAFPEAPATSFVVPAPDGALAGFSVLTGLAIAYGIRHHRARRAQ